MSRTLTPKFRGVQVFTYKELEVTTEGFSEANVIGNGGFGLMYRGVLSDGTLAAIKLLRRESKQGERSFRVQVSYCSIKSRLHLVLSLCPFPLVSNQGLLREIVLVFFFFFNS